MNGANGLQQVIDWCVAPVRPDEPGGRDLATLNVRTDNGALRRHQIVQTFQDSRNADWNQVYQDGLAILRDDSKDIYALWAVLAPIPVVRGLGLNGVAASIDACNRFLDGELWEDMYPALPDGLLARAAVFTQLAQRWTTFLKSMTFSAADAELIQQTKERAERFGTLVEKHLPEDTRPPLSEMRELLHAAASNFPLETEQELDADADPSTPDSPDSPVSPVSPHDDAGRSDGSRDEIVAAYESALDVVARQPQLAINRMTEVVERQAQRNGQFRGKVYLGDLYLRAGHVRLARELLEFLDEECRKITLEDWEPELCGKLWATLYQAISSEPAESGGEPPKNDRDKLDELFKHVCRVDAKQALALRTI